MTEQELATRLSAACVIMGELLVTPAWLEHEPECPGIEGRDCNCEGVAYFKGQSSIAAVYPDLSSLQYRLQ